MSAVAEKAVFIAPPAARGRGGGFWRRVARHVLRDKVALLCAAILAAIRIVRDIRAMGRARRSV